MALPFSKFLENFKPKPQEINELFSGINLSIHPKQLLKLTLDKISLNKAIFEIDPNSKLIFTEETMQMVIDKSLVSEKHSIKDILSIFANQNPKLIQKILDLEIFSKILIINDIKEYRSEHLNIKQGSDLSFELLEKKDLKLKISIKTLVDFKGSLNFKYLEHLPK